MRMLCVMFASLEFHLSRATGHSVGHYTMYSDRHVEKNDTQSRGNHHVGPDPGFAPGSLGVVFEGESP